MAAAVEMSGQQLNVEAQPLNPNQRSTGEDIQARVMSNSGEEEGGGEWFIRIIATFLCTLLLFIPIFWFSCIKVVDQYKRLVHFRLGKVVGGAGGPGIFIMLPCIDEYRLVDLRVKTIDVPPQEMLTKDSVTVSVNAVVFYHVNDPIKSVLCSDNFRLATSLLGQTTLRAVVGSAELDELLSKREYLGDQMRDTLDEGTDPWGVKVLAVEISDVRVPSNMQRAMASQAEAERDRRAKIISSEGELQASNALLKAADMMTNNPSTMQLRYLQTLNQISQDQNSTVVFPLPISLLTVADAEATKAKASRGKSA
jgi:erythrocyte band 7 integral membrane protein